jgi:hypothetical protein
MLVSFDDFAEFLKDNMVDKVIIALPTEFLYGRAASIVAAREEQRDYRTVSLRPVQCTIIKAADA